MPPFMPPPPPAAALAVESFKEIYAVCKHQDPVRWDAFLHCFSSYFTLKETFEYMVEIKLVNLRQKEDVEKPFKNFLALNKKEGQGEAYRNYANKCARGRSAQKRVDDFIISLENWPKESPEDHQRSQELIICLSSFFTEHEAIEHMKQFSFDKGSVEKVYQDLLDCSLPLAEAYQNHALFCYVYRKTQAYLNCFHTFLTVEEAVNVMKQTYGEPDSVATARFLQILQEKDVQVFTATPAVMTALRLISPHTDCVPSVYRMTDADREALAYLITYQGTTTPLRPHEKSFSCKCFECYVQYSDHCESSTHRVPIGEILSIMDASK